MRLEFSKRISHGFGRVGSNPAHDVSMLFFSISVPALSIPELLEVVCYYRELVDKGKSAPLGEGCAVTFLQLHLNSIFWCRLN